MLSFSGGKDSTACLWMLEPYWSQLEVVWMDAGEAHPVVEEYIERIEALVPHFYRIRRDSVAWRGMQTVPHNFMTCCWFNVWQPTLEYVVKRGFTGLIRGQKLADHLKGGIRSGEVDSFGVQHWYPLDAMTDADVVAYLGDRMPPGYTEGRGLPDCRTCPTDFHSLQQKDIQWTT